MSLHLHHHTMLKENIEAAHIQIVRRGVPLRSIYDDGLCKMHQAMVMTRSTMGRATTKAINALVLLLLLLFFSSLLMKQFLRDDIRQHSSYCY